MAAMARQSNLHELLAAFRSGMYIEVTMSVLFWAGGFLTSVARIVLLCLTGLLGLSHVTASAATASGTWALDKIMLSLDPPTKYRGSFVLSNATSRDIYISTKIRRLVVVEGARKLSDADDGALKVFPAEFVLGAGQLMTVYIVAKPERLELPSESFYVEFADVSASVLNGSPDVNVVAGMQLAYNALVNVTSKEVVKLNEESFKIERSMDGVYTLKNLSASHVFLVDSAVCRAGRPLFVDCLAQSGWVRQSILPNEIVKLGRLDQLPEGYSDAAFIVRSGIDLKFPGSVVYLPMTGVIDSKAQ
jgi:hypothetical protein